MPKQRVTIVLPPDLWAKTQQVARERRTSASEYIARALQEMISREGQEARLRAVREIAAMNLPIATPEELRREAAERYESALSERVAP